MKKKKKEYNKAYYAAHREKKKEYAKAYYAAHREEKKVYNIEHREEHKEYKKTYDAEHREERKAYGAARYSTPQGRAKNLLNGYRKMDRERNLGETTITADWIVQNIFTSSCTYCGESDWTKLGTDRIDNSLPHTPDNCICACGQCNSERADKYSVEEFKKIKERT